MKFTKRRSSKRGLLLILGFAAASLGGDCDNDVVSDPTFRDWCGDVLCSWKLEAGRIERVPTWSSYDLGVAFVDTPTRISQSVDGVPGPCLLFTSVANLDPAADVTLGVDFNSDGSVEFTAPLGATQWEEVQTEIRAPKAYQGVTFILTKNGTGTAVLAEMRVQSSKGCTAPPPTIAPNSLSFGEKCSSSAFCARGLTCTGASGDLLCSQCSPSSPCSNGATCATRSVFFPSQCGPGEGLGDKGEPCVVESDCASRICEGAMPVLLVADAGACDLDAPIGAGDPENCEWYGVRGGTCR